MTNPMIARIAFATCSCMPCICKNKAGFTGMPCLDRGRAALQAMREPTEAMLNAFYCYEESKEEIASMWRDAIDAALKEDGENDDRKEDIS